MNKIIILMEENHEEGCFRIIVRIDVATHGVRAKSISQQIIK